MKTMTPEKAQEKINTIMDSLTISEAIQAHIKNGERIEARLEQSKQETDKLLKTLKGE